MSQILEMQGINSEEQDTRFPSTNSWAFCFSTHSVIAC